MIDYVDFELSKSSCNHITVSNKGGLSFFAQRIMRDNMCFLNVGSFRAFISRNCGKNVKYLGPDHCLDRKEVRDELSRRGTKIDSIVIGGVEKFLVAGQYEVGRGLGFFDVNKEGSSINCSPEYREVSPTKDCDFVFVATKNIHKKVPSGRVGFIVFEHIIIGIEQDLSLPFILLGIMLQIMEEAEIKSLDQTQMQITLTEAFLNEFKEGNIEFFDTGSKILRFSNIIDDVEITKKQKSEYIAVRSLDKDDKRSRNGLFCCFK